MYSQDKGSGSKFSLFSKVWHNIHWQKTRFQEFLRFSKIERFLAYSMYSGSLFHIFGPSALKLLSPNLKLVSAIFIKFLFFHQMIAFQNLWKMFFISSKNLFSFSRYSFFFSFFPFLATLSRLKRANGSEIIYDIMNWLG